MKKVYRHAPHLLSFDLTDNDGDTLTLYLRRPDTPTILALSSALMRLQRALKPDADGLDAETYAQTCAELAPLVKRADGLVDEDGAPLTWDELTEAEREDLLLTLKADVVMRLFADLVSSGRLKPDEKKSSAPTSSPSTPTAPADAPAAPEE